MNDNARNALKRVQSNAEHLLRAASELPLGTNAALKRRQEISRIGANLADLAMVELNRPEMQPPGVIATLSPRAQEVVDDFVRDIEEAHVKAAKKFEGSHPLQAEWLVRDSGKMVENAHALKMLNNVTEKVKNGRDAWGNKPYGWEEAVDEVRRNVLQWSPPSSSCPWSNASQIAKLIGLRDLLQMLERALLVHAAEQERVIEQLARQAAATAATGEDTITGPISA